MDAEQTQVPEHDADAELTENGRLVQAHRDFAAELCSKDHRGEDEPDLVTQSVTVAAGQRSGWNRREQKKQKEKPSRSAAHRAGP